MKNLYSILYGWIVGTDSDLFITFYDASAWAACLITLLVVSAAAAAIYYFFVASKVNSATKANYMWTYIIGYIALVIFTPLLCQLAFNQAYNNPEETGIVEQFDVLAHWLKFLYIGLVNLVYYTILYQIWSSVFCNMPGTKANNITLWSIIRGK